MQKKAFHIRKSTPQHYGAIPLTNYLFRHGESSLSMRCRRFRSRSSSANCSASVRMTFLRRSTSGLGGFMAFMATRGFLAFIGFGGFCFRASIRSALRALLRNGLNRFGRAGMAKPDANLGPWRGCGTQRNQQKQI